MLDAERYQRLLETRRRHWARPLTELSPRGRLRQAAGEEVLTPVGRVLQKAARRLAARDKAANLWQRLLPPELLGQAEIVAFDGHTLTVAVPSTSAGFELGRQQAGLLKALKRHLPGLTCIRMEPADENA